jgi:ParG
MEIQSASRIRVRLWLGIKMVVIADDSGRLHHIPFAVITHIGAPSKSTKRLTLDLDEDLHRRIKLACTVRGSTMVEEITKLLEKEFRAS